MDHENSLLVRGSRVWNLETNDLTPVGNKLWHHFKDVERELASFTRYQFRASMGDGNAEVQNMMMDEHRHLRICLKHFLELLKTSCENPEEKAAMTQMFAQLGR